MYLDVVMLCCLEDVYVDWIIWDVFSFGILMIMVNFLCVFVDVNCVLIELDFVMYLDCVCLLVDKDLW